MSTTTHSDEEDRNSTISPDKTPRYNPTKVAILFAYCGVGYQGMQKNPGAKTIEGDLQQALYLSGAVPQTHRNSPKRFDFARSARTDKGVSAVGQVVSAELCVDPPGFVERLNDHLPPQFCVFGYKHVTASFSAKKMCDRRRYVYLLPVFALDPASHRDRESVIASVGSGNELVKCLDCSERGRKVGIQSGISSNTLSALAEFDDKQGNLTFLDNENVFFYGEKERERFNNIVKCLDCSEGGGKVRVQSGISSNTLSALSEFDDKQGNLTSLDNENVFFYGEKERERFNKIVKQYEGTHRFHNFTTRTMATDPSAIRSVISFHANTTVTIDGIEFVKCEVVGQSFMLHQIRKMIGAAVAIMRNCAPESLIQTALKQDVKINVPTAPEVGLYLDECFFSSYNQKWKDTQEEVSMKAYADEAEIFKLKHIYPHIASTEHKEGAVAVWLHSLNYRNYPDLGPEENGGTIEVAGTETKEPTRCNRDTLKYPSHISLCVRPLHHYEKPTVHEIDLEHLATTMKNRLNLVLPFIQELRDRYHYGTETAITNTIVSDVNMMIDTAMAVTYNRLRYILQSYEPTIFVAQMNPRSPLSNKYKFPAYISFVLSSIGPLRIMDGPEDMLIVYATSANRSQTYGRAQHFDFNVVQFFRLIDNLAAIGVPLAPIKIKGSNREGSFFPTILLDRKNGLWEFISTFHHSNYKPRDIMSAWLTLNDDPALRAFGDCSLRIECCTNPDFVNAVIASRAEGVPDDLDGATAPARLVGGAFHVNVFGVRPAVAAEGGNPVVAAAVYILGRGRRRYYCTSLARDLNERELSCILRDYIFKTSWGN